MNFLTRSMRGLASLRPKSSGWKPSGRPTIPMTSRACGAFVILNHDGMVRIERGFIRAEDEKPEPETAAGGRRRGRRYRQMKTAQALARMKPGKVRARTDEDEDDDDHKPLSDILVRDLTAHRTLGLRLALSEQPEVAIVAVTHALVSANLLSRRGRACCRHPPVKTDLAAHADGIEDTKAGKAWADRHASWARQMPRDVDRSVDLCG